MATNATAAAKKTTRKKKTAAELKATLDAAKKRVAALESKAYEGELAEAIAASNIVSEFNKIKARYEDIAPVNILQAIGKAVKITRVVVTQSEPQKRTTKKN
jgi:hypothetical protein